MVRREGGLQGDREEKQECEKVGEGRREGREENNPDALISKLAFHCLAFYRTKQFVSLLNGEVILIL